MRRPPRELIADAQMSICSDKFIFAADRDKIIKEIDVLMNNKGNKAFTDAKELLESEKIISPDTLDF